MTIFHLNRIWLQLLPTNFINFLWKIVANVNINNDEEERGSEIFTHWNKEAMPIIFLEVFENLLVFGVHSPIIINLGTLKKKFKLHILFKTK
jgi:hypothetical protein